eukprot:TRINITY_DN2917_c0_g3_i2.p1 TRINITY_DN2917_c0_g3~~TRINITY_DN2917_c0_g3_i2.p1  ORF type:complete len:243 (-),score=34.98 TRINITY_DN2917_c0_g3_i2:35-763(-)
MGGNVNAYFPQETWFNLTDGSVLQTSDQPATIYPMNIPLNASLPTFLRGGEILPLQDVRGVFRAEDLDNRFRLVVAMPSKDNISMTAKGRLLLLKDYSISNVQRKCTLGNSCKAEISVKYIEEVERIRLEFIVTVPTQSNNSFGSNRETVLIDEIKILFTNSTALITRRIEGIEMKDLISNKPMAIANNHISIKQTPKGNTAITLALNNLEVSGDARISIDMYTSSAIDSPNSRNKEGFLVE